MNKPLIIEALKSYRLHCVAQASKMKQLGDESWKVWAQKGMDADEMLGQFTRKELVIVEQQVMDV